MSAIAVCQMNAIEVTLGTSEDERAIQQLVEAWTNGWQGCNSQVATEGFTENTDWLNAFGVKKKGREEVEEFLDWVFSLPNAKERKNSETLNLIRFIKSDVALVYCDFQVEKQRYVTGEEMGSRKGHDLRVMVKENGKWQIASMFIMDEKPSCLDKR